MSTMSTHSPSNATRRSKLSSNVSNRTTISSFLSIGTVSAKMYVRLCMHPRPSNQLISWHTKLRKNGNTKMLDMTSSRKQEWSSIWSWGL